eukprot:GHVU01032294.1.p1 GENE.GHVU01032294.1~~GHVU01032294.1.p1  ORF type:complete len:102 (-),score=12.82 GHVU01032294.1:427-732(-)
MYRLGINISGAGAGGGVDGERLAGAPRLHLLKRGREQTVVAAGRVKSRIRLTDWRSRSVGEGEEGGSCTSFSLPPSPDPSTLLNETPVVSQQQRCDFRSVG